MTSSFDAVLRPNSQLVEMLYHDQGGNVIEHVTSSYDAVLGSNGQSTGWNVVP